MATAGAEPALVVSLITLGPGDPVWEKFGHNMLRVRDTLTGYDMLFHWGVFDFSEKGFWPRLVRGKMLYSTDALPSGQMLPVLDQIDRDAWEQILNLTPAQEAELLRLAEENQRPENRNYEYQYYLDNCSTRIRDLLDRVLNGTLRTTTEKLPGEMSYRAHTRRLLARDPLPYFGIQLVLGHPADREISRWDEMFLPVRMMRHLNDVQLTDPGGAGKQLVVATNFLARSSRAPELETVQPRLLSYAILSLIMAALILFSARRVRPDQPSGGATWPFLTIAMGWTIFAGLAGTLALCMWLLTGHTFMYQNETILLMNPLHLVLAFLLRGAVRRKVRTRATIAVAGVIAILTLAEACLYALPGVGQMNVEMVLLALFPNLALFEGVCWIAGVRMASGSRSRRAAVG